MRLRNRPGKTLVLIIAVCAVISAVVGVGTGFFLSKRASASAAAKKKLKAGGDDGAGPRKPPETIYSLGEMVVNMGDQQTLRYAKLTVAIGFAKKLSPEKLKEIEPLLRDAVIDVLTNRSFEEVHRRGGVQRLKLEIRDLVQKRLPSEDVSEAYFEGFAMQ